MQTRLLLLFTGTLFLSFSLQAQFSYKIDISVPVEENGKTLSMPWSGGINAAQFNTIDLNGDSRPDLVVFDRHANRVLTFLNRNNTYEYSPAYDYLFPPQVRHWLLLRDFNGDGKKDLFTGDAFGIVAFINTTKEGENLSWRPFNAGRPLLTQGASSVINIKINSADIPAIDDIDGDGDLDILHIKFTGAPTVEWQKNLSIDKNGNRDSLQFERVLTPVGGWGNFEECGCGQFAFFGMGCSQRLGGYVQHVSGKALLTLDMDNDGDQELVLSEEGCPSAFILTNEGSAQRASITTSASFPARKPISIVSFPASFLEDVNFDGKADLIASPNVSTRPTGSFTSFRQSVWLYTNIGSVQNPEFNFVKNNFLQDEMIDLGDYAAPAFTDYDGDGDQDMFIGRYGDGITPATLSQYENIGSSFEPSFRLVNSDFANLSTMSLEAIKPQFVDINGDRNMDLIFTITTPSRTAAAPSLDRFKFILGKAKNRLDLSDQPVQNRPFLLAPAESIFISDIDLDGATDLLVSRTSGALEYWRNTQSSDRPAYSLEDDAFIGLGLNTVMFSSIFIADLDANGDQDLILGDRAGTISIYKDFRSASEFSTPIKKIIYNPFEQSYVSKNWGGWIQPTAVSLFNNQNRALVVGTIAGGVILLKSSAQGAASDEQVISVYPTTLFPGERLSLTATQNSFVQLFTLTGQAIFPQPIFIAAKTDYFFSPSSVHLASGIYIVRFTVGTKVYSRYLAVL